LYDCHNNFISNNLLNNAFGGFYLIDSQNNFIWNNAFNTSGYGIHFIYSFNNSLYYNNIVNNANNSLVEPNDANNIWNSEKKYSYIYNGRTFENNLGNYWKNYTGIDANRDGIGDTPFVIGEYNVDYYPLMEPIENYKITEMVESSELSFDQIILIIIISGGVLIGVAIVLLIIRKKRDLN
jgi:parallel beta-helix repeat protein